MEQAQPNPDDMLTVNEVAEILDLNPETVRKEIRLGHLRARRPSPRKTRIARADLERFQAKAWNVPGPESNPAGEPQTVPTVGAMTVFVTYRIELNLSEAQDAELRKMTGDRPVSELLREMLTTAIEARASRVA